MALPSQSIACEVALRARDRQGYEMFFLQAFVDTVSTDCNEANCASMRDRIHVHAVADGGFLRNHVLSGVLVELHTSDTSDLDCLLQRDDEEMIPTAVFDISLCGSQDDGEQ